MMVLKTLKAIYEILRDNLKLAIKRMFCKHTYKWTLTSSGRSTLTGEDIIFDYDFECTKCGKYLSVKMDRGRQLDGVNYVSCLIKKENN